MVIIKAVLSSLLLLFLGLLENGEQGLVPAKKEPWKSMFTDLVYLFDLLVNPC